MICTFATCVRRDVPEGVTGVYVFHDRKRAVYVGKSTDVRARLLNHLGGAGGRFLVDMRVTVFQAAELGFCARVAADAGLVISAPDELSRAELAAIAVFCPAHNVAGERLWSARLSVDPATILDINHVRIHPDGEEHGSIGPDDLAVEIIVGLLGYAE